jgi:Uma2 family endonuclease
MSETIAPFANKAWTEAELEALPDNGYKYELVDGELVMSPKNNFQHENICNRLQYALESFNRTHRLGVVLGSGAGYWMENRNCRAPDVSFIGKDRVIKLGFKFSTRKFFPGGPDLAVEVLSRSNTRADINARLKDYFASGTQIAWVIDPENESVEICHSAIDRKLMGTGGSLEGEKLLPGFIYPIADLFRELDWE